MQLSKRIILIILFALGMLWGEGERKATNFYYYGTSDHNYLKKLGAEDDTPSLPLISWIGVGRLGKVTVTNTGDNGYYERPAGWPGYDGTQVSGFGTGNGNTGEFPQGANQHYIWDAGIWIGGLFLQKRTQKAIHCNSKNGRLLVHTIVRMTLLVCPRYIKAIRFFPNPMPMPV
jgi:hypothetical protein